MKVNIRYFTDDISERVEECNIEKLNMSRVIDDMFIDTLHDNRILDNDHIVCTVYQLLGKMFYKIGFSSFITKEESQRSSVIHSICNETGLEPVSKNMLKISVSSDTNTHVYICNIKNMVTSFVVPNFQHWSHHDNKQVGALLYGKLSDCIKKYDDTTIVLPSDSNIKGVVFIPVWYIRLKLDLIKNQQQATHDVNTSIENRGNWCSIS
jgi:hypothetical protein